MKISTKNTGKISPNQSPENPFVYLSKCICFTKPSSFLMYLMICLCLFGLRKQSEICLPWVFIGR